ESRIMSLPFVPLARIRTLAAVALFLMAGEFACSQDGKFLGKFPNDWIKQLESKSPSARRAAAFALGKLGTASYHQGIAALAGRLGEGEGEADVRDAAAYALGEIGISLRRYQRESANAWSAVGEKLVHALGQDKEARVRRSAAYGIGGFGQAAATARELLRAALRDASPDVRQNAAWALGQLGKADAAETLKALAQVFDDADGQVRRDAVAAIGEIGRLRDAASQEIPNPAVGPLLEMLKREKDATIRSVALDALVN